jgi:hypothetical protein
MPTEFLRAEWFCEGRGYCHPLCGRHEHLRLITRQIRVGDDGIKYETENLAGLSQFGATISFGLFFAVSQVSFYLAQCGPSAGVRLDLAVEQLFSYGIYISQPVEFLTT